MTTLTAINLRGKVSKIQRTDDGLRYETLFVRADSDLSKPDWTTRSDDAAIFPWDQAEDLAKQFGGHAVVVGGQTEVAERTQAASIVKTAERIASYQRELERRHLD